MARPPRIQIADLTQHVINRGNNRCDIFRAEQDYLFFLLALRDAAVRHQLDVHSYALMTNHFHLVATPRSATGLSDAMQVVGTKYVGYFNRAIPGRAGCSRGHSNRALSTPRRIGSPACDTSSSIQSGLDWCPILPTIDGQAIARMPSSPRPADCSASLVRITRRIGGVPPRELA
jgi:REP element-mobilizing transposase RayT